MNPSTDSLLNTAAELLLPFSRNTMTPEPDRLDVLITPELLLPAVQALFDAKWGYLAAITGMDHPGNGYHSNDEKQWDRLGENLDQREGTQHPEGYLEALYHFCNQAAVVTLRVRVRYTRPLIPSVCGIIPSATLFERELIEMFGIELEGTPDTSRLLLPDEWPEGVYPLRKDFSVSNGANSADQAQKG